MAPKPSVGQQWHYKGTGPDSGKVVTLTILGLDTTNGEVHMRPNDAALASSCSFADRARDPKKSAPPKVHIYCVPSQGDVDADGKPIRIPKGLVPGDCYANLAWDLWNVLQPPD